MNFNRWQGEFLGNLGVLDATRLVQRLALHPFGDERRGRNGGSASIRLEAGILDDALLADTDLQFHDVTAGRRADHAGAHLLVRLVEGPHIAGILVMVDDLVAVCHF